MTLQNREADVGPGRATSGVAVLPGFGPCPCRKQAACWRAKVTGRPLAKGLEPILLETVGLDVEGQDFLTQFGIKLKEAWVDNVEEIAKEDDVASSLAKGSPMRYRRS